MRYRKHLLIFVGLVVASVFVTSQATSYRFINERNCPSGSPWSAADQPEPYWINQNGSATMSMNEVESISQDSFSAWGAPTCSGFMASYQGTTSQTALQNNGNTVLSFESGSWPTQLGNVNQTIGVTLTSFRGCEIVQAPILFNEVGFTFTTSGNGGTDFQSIATHEIGHNLGLAHSASRSATMYAAYGGGTGTRSLEQDDIDGVCALYPPASCSSDAECGSNQVCNSGTCEIAPCTSDADCEGNEVCNTSTGSCEIPPCQSDADCSGGTCNNGVCESDCVVCQPCTQNSDCDSNGFCADFGGGNNKCIVTCGSQGTCPGDSRCFGLQQDGQTYYICLNPDADNESVGACPDSYTCSEDGGSSDPCQGVSCPSGEVCSNGQCVDDGGSGGGSCNGLGNSCANNGANCTADNDICLQPTSGEAFCSCTCTQDSDCGSGNQCVQLSDGSMGCIPGGGSSDPCEGVSCPTGQVCSNGQCVDDGSGGNTDTGGTGTEDTGTGGNTDTGGTGSDDAGGNGGETLDGGMRLPDSGATDQERNESGSQSGVCSAVGSGDSVPASLLALLIGFGLMAVRRKRRRE